MAQQELRIGVIFGSVRDGRLCDTIVNWVMRELRHEDGITLNPIDPKTLGFSIPSFNDSRHTVELLRREIERSDGFIVVTPEYNHGYPAALKHLIDSVGVEWQLKPVAFVSYGGVSGGLRAVEQLRLVFAELHAITLRDCVSLAYPWDKLDGRGELVERAATEALLHVMKHLKWWSETLRVARRTKPYEGRVA